MFHLDVVRGHSPFIRTPLDTRHDMSQKTGRTPAVTARQEKAFTTHLPVLTQIEIVFHGNSFGASLMS